MFKCNSKVRRKGLKDYCKKTFLGKFIPNRSDSIHPIGVLENPK